MSKSHKNSKPKKRNRTEEEPCKERRKYLCKKNKQQNSTAHLRINCGSSVKSGDLVTSWFQEWTITTREAHISYEKKITKHVNLPWLVSSHKSDKCRQWDPYTKHNSQYNGTQLNGAPRKIPEKYWTFKNKHVYPWKLPT